MFSIKNEVLIRVYVVAAAVLLAAVFIFIRLYQLAVVDAHIWKEKAKKKYVEVVDVKADRGNILADDGSLLATSLPYFDIHFDAHTEGLTQAAFDQNIDSLSIMLAAEINKEYTPGAWKEFLLSYRNASKDSPGARYALIASRVPYYQMLKIKNFPLFRLGKHRGGLIVEQVSQRERPFKMLAQRTIGYVREGALPVGLEGHWDKVLGGSLGKQLMLRVPGDIYIPMNDLAEIEPKAGDDIVTTLDINIQDVTENALLEACQRHQADHGCAVVMEVATGKIRAIANIGKTEQGYWETYNYAVGERVEPGSLMKLAAFMALMEDGALKNFDEKVAIHQGKVKIYEETLLDAEAHGQDSMTVRQIFEKSSNVGTAILTLRNFGSGNRAGRFVEILKNNFNLDKPTGIEVGGEEMPVLKEAGDKKAGWSGTTLPWMSIGYEMLLTPLQVLQFFNAVANDGRMMKPYIVQRIEHFGETVREFPPTVLKRSIASSETIRRAKNLLEGVVLNGTASNIRSPHYRIAGKTGTAQLNYHKFKTQKGIRHQAAFCGYFPADRPVYSCIVVISEPKQGGYHGSEVAAPVFKKIADKCFAMKAHVHQPLNAGPVPRLTAATLPNHHAGARKDLESALKWLKVDWQYNPDESDWAVLKTNGDTLQMLRRNVPEKTIPSVIGMGLKDAVYLLENRGCRIDIRGVGHVVRQSIPPGTVVNGQTIVLWLE